MSMWKTDQRWAVILENLLSAKAIYNSAGKMLILCLHLKHETFCAICIRGYSAAFCRSLQANLRKFAIRQIEFRHAIPAILALQERLAAVPNVTILALLHNIYKGYPVLSGLGLMLIYPTELLSQSASCCYLSPASVPPPINDSSASHTSEARKETMSPLSAIHEKLQQMKGHQN